MRACIVWHGWTSFQEGCLAIYFESGYYGWKCPWNSRRTSVTHYHALTCHLCIWKTRTCVHVHTKIHPDPQCSLLSSASAWMSVRELAILCVQWGWKSTPVCHNLHLPVICRHKCQQPVVVMLLPHFLPNLHYAWEQLCILVSLKINFWSSLTLSFGIRCSRKSDQIAFYTAVFKQKIKCSKEQGGE